MVEWSNPSVLDQCPGHNSHCRSRSSVRKWSSEGARQSTGEGHGNHLDNGDGDHHSYGIAGAGEGGCVHPLHEGDHDRAEQRD